MKSPPRFKRFWHCPSPLPPPGSRAGAPAGLGCVYNCGRSARGSHPTSGSTHCRIPIDNRPRPRPPARQHRLNNLESSRSSSVGVHDDDGDVVLAEGGRAGGQVRRRRRVVVVRHAWQEFRNATLLTTRRRKEAAFLHLGGRMDKFLPRESLLSHGKTGVSGRYETAHLSARRNCLSTTAPRPCCGRRRRSGEGDTHSLAAHMETSVGGE